MKKNKLVFFLFFSIFILSACSSSSEQLETNIEKNENISRESLDMQAFFLEVPDNYSCSGGFVDGFRYQEARCINNSREDYEIVVNFGLTATRIDPEVGIIANQIVVRSHDLTGGVCQVHSPQYLNLDAKYYLCFHEDNNQPTISLGVTKSYDTYARWFESDLLINKEEEYNQDDYIEILEKFLNQSIKIDWNEFKNE